MIKVSNVQKGNKLLEYLVKTSWYFDSNMLSDYEINNTTCVLFLSLRFHICKPEYISKRLKKCMGRYKVHIVILEVDIKNYESCIEEIFDKAYAYRFTLVLSFRPEESSRYIWALDVNGSRRTGFPRKEVKDSRERFISAFPKLNKNDIVALRSSFGNIKSLVNAKVDVLENINGIGKTKAQYITKYMEMGFKY